MAHQAFLAIDAQPMSSEPIATSLIDSSSWRDAAGLAVELTDIRVGIVTDAAIESVRLSMGDGDGLGGTESANPSGTVSATTIAASKSTR